MLPTPPTRPIHPVLGALLATVLGLTLGLAPTAAPPAHADPVPASEPDDATSTPEEAEAEEVAAAEAEEVAAEAEDESSSVEEPEAPVEDDESSETTDGSAFRVQPQSVTVPEGEPVVIPTTVLSPFAGEVGWLTSTDGGVTWRMSTSPAVPVAAGARTVVTLILNEINGANANRDGEYRRAVLTYVDDLGETHVEYSDVAVVTVTPRTPTVSEQPQDVQVVAGRTATFRVGVTGSTFPNDIHWQRSATADGPWSWVADGSGATLALDATTGMDGTWYRARIANGSGQDVHSEPAQLRVAHAMPDVAGAAAPGRDTGELAIFDPDRTHSGVMEVVAPAGARITAIRTNSAADLDLTISEDGRSAVSNRAGTWGMDTTRVWVTLTVDDDQQPEAVLDDGVARVLRTDGSVLAQADLSVTVLGIAPEITVQPGTQDAVHGQDVTFHAEATGLPVPTVRWESSRDGVDWTPLPGETGTTLTLDHVTTDMDGTLYRAVFTNLAAPDGVPSDTGTLRVQPVRPVHLTIAPRVQVVNRLPA